MKQMLLNFFGEVETKNNERALSPIYLDETGSFDNVVVLKRRNRRRIAFGWYGGKFSHLD